MPEIDDTPVPVMPPNVTISNDAQWPEEVIRSEMAKAEPATVLVPLPPLVVSDLDVEEAFGAAPGAVYLCFDTETTGLFVFKDKVTGVPVPADDPSQPRLASFAAIGCDAFGLRLYSMAGSAG